MDLPKTVQASMEKLNEYLQNLVSLQGYELRLEPNKKPCVLSSKGVSEIAVAPILGAQISGMIFPLIPNDVKMQLPNKSEVEFFYSNNLGQFNFVVRKSPQGFNVVIRPLVSTEQEISKTKPEKAEESSKQEDFYQKPESLYRQVQHAQSHREDVTISQSKIVIENLDQTEEKLDDYPRFDEVVSFGQPEIGVSNAVTGKSPIQSEEFYNKQNFQMQSEAVMQSHPEFRKEQVQESKVSFVSSARARELMEKMFNQMMELGASDLHLSSGVVPMIRKDGKVIKFPGYEEVFSPEKVRELLLSIMPERNKEEFAERHDTDFSYQMPQMRLRANVFMDRKGMGGVFRLIPTKIIPPNELGLPKAVIDLCFLPKGLIVVTGPTGSGKSTTLASLVDFINQNRDDHIITIEDPIEFVHENKRCLVNQREVHVHTRSFKDALRAALREDPDIVLVGEMRDLETISIAIETAETGHLVFGTLHTSSAASTVDRIIDQFPSDRQQQIRVMLSESLKAVIAQTLLPKKGGGRVAAFEILIVTPAISNLIREGKTYQIPSAMQTGKALGMVMLNDSLLDLVKKGIVEPRDAYLKAVDKIGFEALLQKNGIRIW
jgi:twitching motility protein PilT